VELQLVALPLLELGDVRRDQRKVHCELVDRTTEARAQLCDEHFLVEVVRYAQTQNFETAQVFTLAREDTQRRPTKVLVHDELDDARGDGREDVGEV
jgi:hypothetical protein